MYKAVLLLGSNKGFESLDSEQILEQATLSLIDELLPSYLEVGALEEVVATTPIIETAPCGEFEKEFDSNGKEQPTPPFKNMAISCLTELEPQRVLGVCMEVEKRFGRTRRYKKKGLVYHSRTLDIDILRVYELAESKSIRGGKKAEESQTWREIFSEKEELKLPHPQVVTRAFVGELLTRLEQCK